MGFGFICSTLAGFLLCLHPWISIACTGTPSLLVPPLLLLSVVGAYGSRSFEGWGGGNCHSYQLNCTAFPSIPLATHLHAVINHSHLTSIRESSLPVMQIMLPHHLLCQSCSLYKTTLNPSGLKATSSLSVFSLTCWIPVAL